MTAVTKHSMENDGESTADISFKVTFSENMITLELTVVLPYDRLWLIGE